MNSHELNRVARGKTRQVISGPVVATQPHPIISTVSPRTSTCIRVSDRVAGPDSTLPCRSKRLP